jgi:hypothetical protein
MLRFQFAAEGGWDVGGALAGVVAAAICFFGLPVEAATLPALPMVLVQALFLERSYAVGPRRAGDAGADVLIAALGGRGYRM